MKIAIIGGGAVGLLFASYLQENNDVILYTRTEEQSKHISEKGLVRKHGVTSSTIHIPVRSIHDWEDGGLDLIIFCVKQYALEDILKTISFRFGIPLLFVQNGMGHLPTLQSIKARTIYVGSVEHGALRENDHTVQHTGIGITKIAYFRREQGDEWIVEQLLAQAIDYFPFQFERDYYEMLTTKLVVNAVINPLTAVLGVKNGSLLVNKYYRLLFSQLLDEVCIALNLPRKTYFDKVVSVCHTTAKNESSMLKDVKNNRKTEIDAILGYVIGEALKKEKRVPLTLAFYQSIKGKEWKEGGD